MRRSVFLLIIVSIAVWPVFTGRSSIAPFSVSGIGGDGVITIFNTHSKELETIRYKEGEKYIGSGIEELNRMLRCRLTGQEAQMSLRLIELVDNIEDHFGVDDIEVISGYRSPTLNGALRASGHRVASRSLHMEGLAMDIKIPGVPLQQIRDYARSLKVGGVGYYAGQFVHVDVGPVRYW